MAKTVTALLSVLLLSSTLLTAQQTPPPSPKPAPPKAPNAKAAEAKPAPEKPTKTKAALITLNGTIDGGLHSSLERRIDEARENKCSILFFEIDTYGGALQAAFDISELLSGISDAKTVAYVPKKAISAGALISVACNEIVMGPIGTLGDCEPIIPHPEKGMITAPEKMQTVLRATFRNLALKNGYPESLAEAMVTKEMEVYRVTIGDTTKFETKAQLDQLTEKEKQRIIKKKLVVSEGQLLTMTSKEALDYGFAKKLVPNREALFKLYGVDGADVVVFDTNWSEEMVRFISALSPILIAIGLMALYMEFKVPGFGLPGIVAIVCFALVFFSKYLVGLAEQWEVLIFALGMVLLAVEIFVLPGFGIAGIMGLALIGLALLLAFQPFVVPVTPFEIEMTKGNILKLLGSMVASIVGICLLAKYLPETSAFGRIVLRAAEKTDSGYVVGSAEKQELVGKKGVVVSSLRPVGRARIGDDIVSVVTQGEMLEKDTNIEVIEVKGNRIVVRET